MFKDRTDAGSRLAVPLMRYRDEQPVVLGLPRGGVVVAAEVARALGAELDVLVVRKLRAPSQPELAIGAITIAGGPMEVLNEELVASIGVEPDYLAAEIAIQLDAVRSRLETYRRGRPAVALSGRTVIVIDDGIATGATARVGLRAVRAAGPSRVVLAVPVAPQSTVARLGHDVDDVVCLEAPTSFGAVGAFYDDFIQTTDDEVVRLLEESKSRKVEKSKPELRDGDG